MRQRVVGATEFKSKCFAILDEVADGTTITITKRGRAVATLLPAKKKALKSPAGMWAGKMSIVGDIVNCDLSNLWTVVTVR